MLNLYFTRIRMIPNFVKNIHLIYVERRFPNIQEDIFKPRPRVTRAEYVHQSRYDELLVAAALKEIRNVGQIGMVLYQGQG
jgi:hypothetical protein